MDVVYITCEADTASADSLVIDETTLVVPDNPVVTLYALQSAKTDVVQYKTALNGLQHIAAVDPAVSYYTGYAALAFVLDSSMHEMDVHRMATSDSQPDIKVNLSVDTEGYTFNDPLNESMNSIDAFKQQVKIAYIPINSSRRASYESY